MESTKALCCSQWMSGRGRVTESSPPTVPNRNTTPVLVYATISEIVSILIILNSCWQNQTTLQLALVKISISKKINTGKIAMCMDKELNYHVAALCFQIYTVWSSLWGPQEAMELKLMASSCAKSCSLMPRPTHKALKSTDSVGGWGYIEEAGAVTIFLWWFL